MVDVAENVAGWLLGQLESLPTSLLRDRTYKVPQRLFNQLMGEREAAELGALLVHSAHSEQRENVVLLPGVMGSLLSSVCGISTMLWVSPTVILDGHINLLDLDASGAQDLASDVHVIAVGIEKVFYLSLILSLARETRLYEFPYDWRRSCLSSAEQLHLAMNRWSEKGANESTNQQFVLVGHSMGGAVIRAYMALYPAEAERLISKTILLASPLQGAADAIALLSGIAPTQQVIEHLNPANKVRQLVVSFPSAYELLPPPPDLFESSRPYPVNWDLYNNQAWGSSHLSPQHLDAASRYHRLVAKSDPQIPLYQIAGCGLMTMTDIRVSIDDGKPSFTPIFEQSGNEGGDDTVPLYSSWNQRVKTYFITEHHQHIPGNPLVRQAVLDLVHDRQPGLSSVPTPEPESLVSKFYSSSLVQQVNELRQRFEKGTFTRDDLARLFL